MPPEDFIADLDRDVWAALHSTASVRPVVCLSAGRYVVLWRATTKVTGEDVATLVRLSLALDVFPAVILRTTCGPTPIGSALQPVAPDDDSDAMIACAILAACDDFRA